MLERTRCLVVGLSPSLFSISEVPYLNITHLWLNSCWDASLWNPNCFWTNPQQEGGTKAHHLSQLAVILGKSANAFLEGSCLDLLPAATPAFLPPFQAN